MGCRLLLPVRHGALEVIVVDGGINAFVVCIRGWLVAAVQCVNDGSKVLMGRRVGR